MKKMLFIINPRSGKEQIRSRLLEILDSFVKAGYGPSVYITQGPMRITVPPGCRTAMVLLPFETSIPTALYILRTSKSEFAWIPAFLIADSISWGIKRTWCGSSTCINRTAAMTGWLTGFLTDANGPRRTLSDR